MLDNDQEVVSGNNQWTPYSLGRRDVPPDNLMKKVIIVQSLFLSLMKVFVWRNCSFRCNLKKTHFSHSTGCPLPQSFTPGTQHHDQHHHFFLLLLVHSTSSSGGAAGLRADDEQGGAVPAGDAPVSGSCWRTGTVSEQHVSR